MGRSENVLVHLTLRELHSRPNDTPLGFGKYVNENHESTSEILTTTDAVPNTCVPGQMNLSKCKLDFKISRSPSTHPSSCAEEHKSLSSRVRINVSLTGKGNARNVREHP